MAIIATHLMTIDVTVVLAAISNMPPMTRVHFIVGLTALAAARLVQDR